MKIIVPLIVSPILGFGAGFLLMILLYWLLRRGDNEKINNSFSKIQIASAALMAYSHGANDAQKSMGIITMALFSASLIPSFDVPLWVKIICAIAMALGVSLGGWRIIKTMGVNMIKLLPINGFAAETGAALVIQAATFLGAPISTTHVISTSILGVGAAKRFHAVRWNIARNIIWAWVLTIPICAALAGIIYQVIKLIS
jgi:PiT family inorganic phosphate transporter